MRLPRSIETLAVLAVSFLPVFCANKANVELILVEPGGKTGTKRSVIYKKATPGPGKELKILVTSDTDSVVSVAAFNRNRDLVYSVPRVTNLNGNKRRELPEGTTWNWTRPEQVSDIYVILTNSEMGDFARFRDLIAKMNASKDSPELHKLQGDAVLRWIETQLRSPATAVDYSVKQEPTPIGGLLRGGDGSGAPVDIPDGRSVVVHMRLEH